MNDLFIWKLIRLGSSMIKADSFKEAVKLLVNELNEITNALKVVLVPIKKSKRILSVSGNIEATQDNEFASAMNEMRKKFVKENKPQIILAENLPDNMQNTRKLLKNISGSNVLWAPVIEKKGTTEYGLWIERMPDAKWKKEEIRALLFALPFFAVALNSFQTKLFRIKKYIAASIVTVLIILMFLPVHSRVNAPFQITPDSPWYVFAPIEGILKKLHIKPGQQVKANDIIFSYDSMLLEKKRDEAVQALVSSKAEIIRLEDASYTDNYALSKIPAQRIIVKRREADADFFTRQLELCDVRSKADGIVILDDPDALIGTFLQTGQMVMRIADTAKTKIKIMVPITDTGLVTKGSAVDIRLDSEPFRVHKAVIERIGYDVVLSEESLPAVIAYGIWNENETRIMPGQRGTAAIQGPKTYLGMQLFRKPIMALRIFFGI